ncbi:hypothetical protein E2C06_32045 [Dankookia rubra]|uniref:Uncharacterized protein n=1 Tax=Dankookia rubra TaxID=1442381 RepID=A0A4R5Q7I9_9PROT|nr:hypothetical protein [Dankookia rubra]TDH58533.1 hypothetical protein E2C06_32045 [Dankookia rubra]
MPGWRIASTGPARRPPADDAASWFDAALDAPATRAPGPGDTAVFGPGEWSATGGGQVGTLLIEDAASLTVAGTGTERLGASTPSEGIGSRLVLQSVLLLANTPTIGHDAVLDLGAAASFEIFPGSPPGPLSVEAGSFTLLGPGDGAGGGHVVLGANNLRAGVFQNGDSGAGNDFAPAAGFSGTGTVMAGTFDQPNIRICDPDHSRPTGSGGSLDAAGDGVPVEGAEPFAGLAAGDALAALSLRLGTTAPGARAGTVAPHPTSGNAAGFLGDLPAVTPTVPDPVLAAEGGGGTDGHHPPGHHGGRHHPEHRHPEHRPGGHGHHPARQHGARAA